jgi:DNA-binding transcriptional regulator YhcF (GntR family)
VVRIDPSAIDKSLPVPVGAQLYGLLSYALSFDDLPQGARLPSVRELAGRLGIAPMTVAQVYQQLRDAGMVDIRPGLGAFTARATGRGRSEGVRMAAFRADILSLIARAEGLGLSVADLAAMIGALGQGRAARVGLELVFAGLFEAPTRDYLAEIRAVLGPRDRIRPLLLAEIERAEAARAACRAADLVLTFVNREAQLRALVPEARVMTLPFLPSRRTRQALAGLDPRSSVAAVAYFEDYVAVMRPSVREFAPQVADIRVSWIASPDLGAVLAAADAVVYASGAEAVADRLAPGIACFEFRHAPDPTALVDRLVPALADLRLGRTGGAAPADPRAARPAAAAG